MIKKICKIVFEDTGVVMEDQGGIPLSKGETLRMFGDGGIFKEYIVMDKIIDCRALDKDWIVDITYTLRRL